MIDTPITMMADLIRTHGPIPTVRVSSAQASGAAKQYSYWGAARYELRLTRDGRVVNVALERARSDRRSRRLAERDASEIAQSEGRVAIQTIGSVSNDECGYVLDEISASRPEAAAAVARHVADLRALPHWVERVAAGAVSTYEPWLSPDDRAAVERRRAEIEALRKRRADSRRIASPWPLTIERRTTWRGVPIVVRATRYGARSGYVRYCADMGTTSRDGQRRTPREAARDYLRWRQRRYGDLSLHRLADGSWMLLDGSGYRREWPRRPSRVDLVAAMIAHGNGQAVRHG